MTNISPRARALGTAETSARKSKVRRWRLEVEMLEERVLPSGFTLDGLMKPLALPNLRDVALPELPAYPAPVLAGALRLQVYTPQDYADMYAQSTDPISGHVELPAIWAGVVGMNLTILGTAGNDTIVVRQWGGLIAVDGVEGWIDAGQVASISIDSYGGDDVIRLDSEAGAGQQPLAVSVLVYAGAGDDVIVGTGGKHWGSAFLHGDAGHDLIWANAGGSSNYIYGDAGDDVLVGGRSHNRLVGGAGSDVMVSGPNQTLADLHVGLQGNDRHYLRGNEWLVGDDWESGVDRLLKTAPLGEPWLTRPIRADEDNLGWRLPADLPVYYVPAEGKFDFLPPRPFDMRTIRLRLPNLPYSYTNPPIFHMNWQDPSEASSRPRPRADEPVLSRKPNGSIEVKYPDGTKITVTPSGDAVLQTPDGATYQGTRDGSWASFDVDAYDPVTALDQTPPSAHDNADPDKQRQADEAAKEAARLELKYRLNELARQLEMHQPAATPASAQNGIVHKNVGDQTGIHEYGTPAEIAAANRRLSEATDHTWRDFGASSPDAFEANDRRGGDARYGGNGYANQEDAFARLGAPFQDMNVVPQLAARGAFANTSARSSSSGGVAHGGVTQRGLDALPAAPATGWSWPPMSIANAAPPAGSGAVTPGAIRWLVPGANDHGLFGDARPSAKASWGNGFIDGYSGKVANAIGDAIVYMGTPAGGDHKPSGQLIHYFAGDRGRIGPGLVRVGQAAAQGAGQLLQGFAEYLVRPADDNHRTMQAGLGKVLDYVAQHPKQVGVSAGQSVLAAATLFLGGKSQNVLDRAFIGPTGTVTKTLVGQADQVRRIKQELEELHTLRTTQALKKAGQAWENSPLVNESNAYTYRVFHRDNRALIAMGSTDGRGVLSLQIRTVTDDKVRSALMKGADQFKAIVKHFGPDVKAIKGSWSYGDNLAEFAAKLAAGASKEEAALSTWTAEQARANGFSTLKSVEVSYNSDGSIFKVEAYFTK